MQGSHQRRHLSKRSAKQVDPFYSSSEWQQLRHKRLKYDRYICNHCGVKCLGKKRGQPSPHVDHVIDRKDRPDLQLDIDNLQTLCDSCHSKKTRATQLDRPAIGLDGYPLQQGEGNG